MLLVTVLCLALVAATTLFHYEVLALLSAHLPRMAIASQLKLLVVILATFSAHVIEIALYAAALWVSEGLPEVGGLTGSTVVPFVNCLYFSAETFTSLGFGDIVPSGHFRLIAGVETLNGLLLIGWSASYAHLSMERYWDSRGKVATGKAAA